MDLLLIILIIIGSLAFVILLLSLISRKVYNRTLIASIVVIYLRLTVHHKSVEQVTEDLSKLPAKNDCKYEIPRLVKITSPIRRFEVDNMSVFWLNETSRDTVLLYLHGGGFVRQPRIHHWKFFNKLSKHIENVVIPIYPKAPNHHPDEVYEIITKLYIDLTKKYNHVILAGDSSGGGLAVGLCLYFNEQSIKQPDKLIVMSPWVDLTLLNPDIEEYQKVDPLISAKSEQVWAKAWAGSYELTNWKISPLYGSLEVLQNVTIFVGTREILYPDIMLFYQKLIDNDVDTKIIVANGMNHVYPIYPIPEARVALKQFVDEVSVYQPAKNLHTTTSKKYKN